MTMTVIVNGEARELADGTTVASMLDALVLRRATAAVERNGEPVAPSEYAATTLHDGDRIELVRAAAGG
jgi:thiamine biosynthesis protein ThiS